MKITLKEWFIFFVAAVFGLAVWFKLAYPEFSFIDLSVDKKQALVKAEKYLSLMGVDCRSYSRSIVFDANDWADTYLQKTIGVTAEEKFIKEHGYEFFFWRVRFFRQLQKEEYILEISPKSGQVFYFEHRIEDVEARLTPDKDQARLKVEQFLKDTCGLNPRDYDFHAEKTIKLDNRIDYGFSWEKKGVYVPWGKGSGGAKLLVGATISGDEVRTFYRNVLDIPERFFRDIEQQLAFGEYVSGFSYLIFIALVTLSIIHVLIRIKGVVFEVSKTLFIYLSFCLAGVNTIGIFNNLQQIMNSYSTSISLSTYLGIYLLRSLMSVLYLSVIFIMPGIAGESLQLGNKSFGSRNTFFYFIRSTFLSRGMAKNIIFGYLLFFIILGFQAGIFFLGQRYFGVWKQWAKLTQFSSAYVPFLSALAVGVTASFIEEIVFRLFGINWFKKYLKNTIAAVVLSAVIWGLGHTQYAIFPVWFRGIEVSLIGIFFGFIFIKYGIIPLLVAHYLFDVFWTAAAYIFGKSPGYLFWGSSALMLIPLGFALFAYLVNRSEEVREIKLALNANQRYNLNVLTAYILHQKDQGLNAEQIKAELVKHDWDESLIETAITQVFGVG